MAQVVLDGIAERVNLMMLAVLLVLTSTSLLAMRGSPDGRHLLTAYAEVQMARSSKPRT